MKPIFPVRGRAPKSALGSLLLAVVLGSCARGGPGPAPAAPTPVAPAVNEALPGPAADERAAPAPAAPSIVVLVRHAEKASDGTPDPPLTERGRRRAECLATLLGPFQPERLITSEYQRTRDTLAPLAKATGVVPEVIEAADLGAWTTALRELPPGSRVVVSGHSNTIPAWVAALGVELPGLDEEGNIPHDDYDRLVQVVLDEHGRALTSLTFAYCTEPTAGADAP